MGMKVFLLELVHYFYLRRTVRRDKRPCRQAGQSGVNVRVKKNIKKRRTFVQKKILKNAKHVRRCPVYLKKTHICLYT